MQGRQRGLQAELVRHVQHVLKVHILATSGVQGSLRSGLLHRRVGLLDVLRSRLRLVGGQVGPGALPLGGLCERVAQVLLLVRPQLNAILFHPIVVKSLGLVGVCTDLSSTVPRLKLLLSAAYVGAVPRPIVRLQLRLEHARAHFVVQGEELPEQDLLVFVLDGRVLLNELALQLFHLDRLHHHHGGVNVHLRVPAAPQIWLQHHGRGLDLAYASDAIVEAVVMEAPRLLLLYLTRLLWTVRLTLCSIRFRRL